ncbi:MAG: V-type ATPase subunit [bacterium]
MMLASAVRYSYINAKVHSLKGRLLQQSDYKNLIQSPGLGGFVECLKSTPYGSGLHESDCSYDTLIGVYYENLFNDYIKIMDSVSGERRALVYHLYQRYELENVKAALRSVCHGRPKEGVSRLLFTLPGYRTVSADTLLESKDLADLIQRLKGTWYHDPLDHAAYRFEQEGGTFPLEMALDLRYYGRLWEIASSLKGRDKGIAQSLIGVQLDALNIVWMIRFKESYLFFPEEILNYGLSNGHCINSRKRKKMAFSIDRDDIIDNLEHTPYKVILNGINDPEAAYTVLLQYLLRRAQRNWTGKPFQIGVILDYIIFKEMEVRTLITITEAKRMGSSTEGFNRYLVHAGD